MAEVTAFFYAHPGNVHYRQGTVGTWIPLQGRELKVSTATQFQVNGDTYKWTKGSWVSGEYYDINNPVGATIKITGNRKDTRAVVQYNR